MGVILEATCSTRHAENNGWAHHHLTENRNNQDVSIFAKISQTSRSHQHYRQKPFVDLFVHPKRSFSSAPQDRPKGDCLVNRVHPPMARILPHCDESIKGRAMETTSKDMLQTMAEIDALFYNNDVAPIVHLQQGVPVTDSMAIARECGRRHDGVLQSLDTLIEDGTISRLEFKPRDYVDARGKKRRMIELTEPGALIAMPFIGGRTARIGRIKMGSAFLAMRDELADQQRGNWLRLWRAACPNDSQRAAHPTAGTAQACANDKKRTTHPPPLAVIA
jgi:Rha family phage regulatory protein